MRKVSCRRLSRSGLVSPQLLLTPLSAALLFAPLAYHHRATAVPPVSTAAGARAKSGRHGLSKASGRESAFQSPLRFDETVRERMKAEQQRQQQQQRSSASGGFRGQDRKAQRFSSTHEHRSFDGAREANEHFAKRSAVFSGGDADPQQQTQPVSSPLVLPYSELAYRSRLRNARLATLLELADAPYAPSPLQVLLDVFSEVNRLEGILASHVETASTQKTTSSITGTDTSVVASSRGDDADAAASLEEVSSSLARLKASLTRSRDVRLILSRVVKRARDVVDAVEVIGDRGSAAELQTTLGLVGRFADSVLAAGAEAAPSTTPGNVQAFTVCELPPATRAEVLHAILDVSSVLGSRLSAVTALDELIALQEEVAIAGSGHHGEDQETGDTSEADEPVFTLDDVVTIVDQAMQGELRPVSAADHIEAIVSCKKARDFDLAISLYRRFMQHVHSGTFPTSADDFSRALTALASCSNTSVHFTELQHLMVSSAVASTVPVSVPLYTALIDAVSRAADNPQRMQIALALYRRLRDGQLTPVADTYAALMACCASTREPTQAFAFYQEALVVCGVASFTPQLYMNLVLSYANAGYGADARRTLDVLVEAGAPLTRGAFHAALSGAETCREAQEIVDMMTSVYAIQPTPHTYAFLVHAAAKGPKGTDTVLQLFDLHEQTLASLVDMDDSLTKLSGETHFAQSSASQAGALEATLLEQFPLYVRAVEHAIMRLRVDPAMDARLGKYLKPLLRIAQQRMNAFTGGMAPQKPTRIPAGVDACIAVLSPDVLANLDEYVEPFVSHYSAIVIPYSSLLALQIGGGKRIEGLSVKGARAGLHDSVWSEVGNEKGAMVEHRRRRLVKFLNDYRDVIHLVSLEEELQWSRDIRRYNISAANMGARCAAFAINLARKDIPGGTKLYAKHDEAAIVLVSANFNNCAKFVSDIKRTFLGAAVGGDRERFAGLREGLEKVFYHNPRTQPAWSPPKLSIRRKSAVQLLSEGEGAVAKRRSDAKAGRRAGDVADAEEAQSLHRQKLSALFSSDSGDGEGAEAASTETTGGPASPAVYEAEEALDADLLMSMMVMDDE